MMGAQGMWTPRRRLPITVKFHSQFLDSLAFNSTGSAMISVESPPEVEKKRQQTYLLLELQYQLLNLQKIQELRRLRSKLSHGEVLPFGGLKSPDEMETQPMDIDLMAIPTPYDEEIRLVQAWLWLCMLSKVVGG